MNKKILILGIAGLVLLSVIYMIFSSRTFRISSTTPRQNSRNSSVETIITINTNKQLLESNATLSYYSVPFGVEGEIEIIDKSIQIKPVGGLLREDQEYTLYVDNIISEEGDVIESFKLIFKTNTDDTPRGKFLRSLPLQSGSMVINYSYGVGQVIVSYGSTLKSAQADVRSMFENYKISDKTFDVTFEKYQFNTAGGGAPSPVDIIESESDESSVN